MIKAMTGIEWIQYANSRSIGKIEFRQVSLEIGTGWKARVLKIRTLRSIENDIAKTVYCAMEPRAFRNINYVVTEQRGKIEPFKIQLYLPYALGTLRNLSSNKRREALIGSDFTYDDMRIWLYEEGHEYEFVEFIDSLIHIRGRCTAKCNLIRTDTAPFDIWLEQDTGFVRKIDYWSADEVKIVRRYFVDEICNVNGILIANRMTMMDYLHKRSTIIKLEHVWYDKPINQSIFESEFRKQTYSYLSCL